VALRALGFAARIAGSLIDLAFIELGLVIPGAIIAGLLVI
jgi:hypothetical protein